MSDDKKPCNLSEIEALAFAIYLISKRVREAKKKKKPKKIKATPKLILIKGGGEG